MRKDRMIDLENILKVCGKRRSEGLKECKSGI